MKTVAVIDLDRWISQFNFDESDISIIDQLSRITQQYRQCHTVNSVVFRLSYHRRFSPINLELTDLGIELQPKNCVDPLTAFYELVTQSVLNSEKSSIDVAIVRLLASIEPPKCSAIDSMVTNHINQRHHYSRSSCDQELAELDLEIMNLSVLREAWQEALLPDDRQLITPYIYRQQQRLNLGVFPSAEMATLYA